jgi:hypothetical protein
MLQIGVDKEVGKMCLTKEVTHVVYSPYTGAYPVDSNDRDREAVATRLRALQHVLGLSDEEMGLAAGVSRQVWANYTSRHLRHSRLIGLQAMRKLKDTFGVTSEWVFLGDASTIQPDLRLKLIEALASPLPPKPRGRRPVPRLGVRPDVGSDN